MQSNYERIQVAAVGFHIYRIPYAYNIRTISPRNLLYYIEGRRSMLAGFYLSKVRIYYIVSL
jgi:hypothetical protein